MDRYRPRKGRIFGGIILLILAGFVLWFIAEGFIIFTPLAKMYSVRGIGGYYVEGKIIELIGPPEERGGGVTQVKTENWIGLHRIESLLPAYIFYHEGLEVGDIIYVPFSQKDFDDMRSEDKLVFAISATLFVIFLGWGISSLCGELAASRYFHKLILNKTYINAHIVKSEYSGNKVRALCGYNNHRFESRWYSKESYPFGRGGEVRVYVDLLKDPEKYLISEK